ncbi:MAG: extracellular solute-binding protein [Lachnospiraceae bacterium]|nr:extracellular solute-binding protein [Lachnospiraceae bacterium]
MGKKLMQSAATTGTFWKKQSRRFLAGVTAACMAVSALPTENMALAEESESAMGRYLEYDVTLPEEEMYLLDLTVLEDGTLRLFGGKLLESESGFEYCLWDSANGGDTWEQITEFPEMGNRAFYSYALCADGSGAAIVMESFQGVSSSAGTEETEGKEFSFGDTSEVTYVYSLFTFDETGVTGEVQLDGDWYGKLYGSRNGNIFYNDFESIYQLDPATGEKVTEYPHGNYLSVDITACGSELVIVTYENLWRYDITTGEALEEDTALSEAIYSGETGSFENASGSTIFCMTEDADGRLFYANSRGIYTHVMDGSVVEQVVDGGLNSLSAPEGELLDLAVAGDVFYTIYFEPDTDSYGIRKYEYSAETASVPENELTIWSLEEDEGIRQSIYLYQEGHPDTYITYEVGITENSGVTASDAIRTLNTEILAGSGPDILILDGLSVETYSSQGLLLDLTDLMEEMKESDGFLENIAYTYQDGDGVWAVPLQFEVPVLVGYAESVEYVCGTESADSANSAESSDSADSADHAESAVGTDALAALAELAAEGAYDVGGAAELLYGVCAGSWTNEDDTLDQELLEKYIHTMKLLAEAYAAMETVVSDSEDVMYYDDESAEAASSYAAQYMTLVNADLTSACFRFFFEQDILVATANLLNMSDFMGYSSAFAELGGGTICTLTGQQENVFVPLCTVGILTTTQNQEVAESFVSYLLSEEGQLSRPEEEGWPVNAAAFDSLLYENAYEDGSTVIFWDNGDDSVQIYLNWPTDEEVEWLSEMVNSLTVRAETGAVQKDVVMEQLELCLNGEIGEEEAVSTIMQKINLYLAE